MENQELLELAARYRESLRQAVYLSRSLDAEGELGTSQVSTLNMVAEAPARVSDIARNLGIKVPSATEAVIKLEAAGLVSRMQDATDARAVRVSLTEAGKDALRRSNERRNLVMASHLARLSAVELASIAAALPAMAKLNSPGAGTTNAK